MSDTEAFAQRVAEIQAYQGTDVPTHKIGEQIVATGAVHTLITTSYTEAVGMIDAGLHDAESTWVNEINILAENVRTARLAVKDFLEDFKTGSFYQSLAEFTTKVTDLHDTYVKTHINRDLADEAVTLLDDDQIAKAEEAAVQNNVTQIAADEVAEARQTHDDELAANQKRWQQEFEAWNQRNFMQYRDMLLEQRRKMFGDADPVSPETITELEVAKSVHEAAKAKLAAAEQARDEAEAAFATNGQNLATFRRSAHELKRKMPSLQPEAEAIDQKFTEHTAALTKLVTELNQARRLLHACTFAKMYSEAMQAFLGVGTEIPPIPETPDFNTWQANKQAAEEEAARQKAAAAAAPADSHYDYVDDLPVGADDGLELVDVDEAATLGA